MNPQEQTPLTPAVLHILLALGNGERHGYGIMGEIAQFTDGKLRIGPGTLYRSIKQMMADGLIEESGERPDPALDDERRRYYRLTKLGISVTQEELRRLTNLIAVAQSRPMLKPDIGGAS